MCNARHLDLRKIFKLHFIGIGLKTELLGHFDHAVQVDARCAHFGHFGQQRRNVVVAVILEYHGHACRPALHHACLANKREIPDIFFIAEYHHMVLKICRNI